MLTRLTELLETQKVFARNVKPALVQYLGDRARALRTSMQESSRRGAVRWRVWGIAQNGTAVVRPREKTVVRAAKTSKECNRDRRDES